MSPPAAYRRIILDTSVLLPLAAYGYLDQTQVTSPRRYQILDKVRGKEPLIAWGCYDDLWFMFREAQKRILTEHVTGQLDVQKLSGILRTSPRELWKICGD